jgi:hypothetical protein
MVAARSPCSAGAANSRNSNHPLRNDMREKMISNTPVQSAEEAVRDVLRRAMSAWSDNDADASGTCRCHYQPVGHRAAHPNVAPVDGISGRRCAS